MKPEQIRIAIAEACGWKRHAYGLGWYKGKHPALMSGRAIPDYLNDLNAMHEAEKVLTDEQGVLYGSILAHIRTRFTDSKWMWHADASQRAEAFLRTIGKWKEL